MKLFAVKSISFIALKCSEVHRSVSKAMKLWQCSEMFGEVSEVLFQAEWSQWAKDRWAMLPSLSLHQLALLANAGISLGEYHYSNCVQNKQINKAMPLFKFIQNVQNVYRVVLSLAFISNYKVGYFRSLPALHNRWFIPLFPRIATTIYTRKITVSSSICSVETIRLDFHHWRDKKSCTATTGGSGRAGHCQA